MVCKLIWPQFRDSTLVHEDILLRTSLFVLLCLLESKKQQILYYLCRIKVKYIANNLSVESKVQLYCKQSITYK